MSRALLSRMLAPVTVILVSSLAGCATEPIENAERDGVGISSGPGGASRPRLLRATHPVPGQYLVVLRTEQLTAHGERVSQVAAELAQVAGGRLMYSYEAALRGFAIAMSEDAVAEVLSDPRVDYIEEDGHFELSSIQAVPSWGLDRIDQRNLPLGGTYGFVSTGRSVHAYVLDSGIRRAHAQFVGRIGASFDAITMGGDASDCLGHGTHVAGIIGGTIHGVAKHVVLHPVRVAGCTGSTTTTAIVAGVNWVFSNRVLPAVVNMSLSGGISAAMESAIQTSINSGIPYVVAAGNSASNACNSSPARMPAVLTIAASDRNDVSASFTNFGSCVDLYGPGVEIVSTSIASNTATESLSGTSMAAAHVTGAFARLESLNPQPLPPGELIARATSGVILNAPPATPNRLLFVDPGL